MEEPRKHLLTCAVSSYKSMLGGIVPDHVHDNITRGRQQSGSADTFQSTGRCAHKCRRAREFARKQLEDKFSVGEGL